MASSRSFLSRCLLSLPALSLVVGLSYGCDSPTQFDDLCGWLADPDNCYREFFIDVGTRCGSTGSRTGAFPQRASLDSCFLDQGGIITFEPPLNPDVPLEEIEELPLVFKFTNPDGTECGEVSFFAKYDFSVKIVGDELPEEGPIPESLVVGGTFAMNGGKETDTLNVACPQGGGFTFDRLQVTRCREYEEMLPHAEIDYNPGGVDVPGVVRLKVFYPPPEGELANAAPVPVLYFDCAIPAAPQLCVNGMQEGSETEIDCGGPFCAARCDDQQKCSQNSDCVSGVCGVVMGLKVCQGP